MPYLHHMKHYMALQWRHNGLDGISNHQPRDYLLGHLIRRRSKKMSKLRGTGLCAGNSPVTGVFPARMASNAEYVSIWWCHHGIIISHQLQQYDIVYKTTMSKVEHKSYLIISYRHVASVLCSLENTDLVWTQSEWDNLYQLIVSNLIIELAI